MRSLAHRWRHSPAAIATGIFALTASVALALDRQSTPPSATAPAANLSQVLDVQHGKAEKGFRLFYPDGWSVDSRRYRNVTEMNAFPEGASAEQRRGAVRLLVIYEQRRSEQDALERLQDFLPAGNSVEISSFEIDGWPAVAKTWTEPPKRRGIKAGQPEYTANWLFTSVAVAVGDTLVRFEAQIPSGDRAMRDLVHQIAKSTRWMAKGDPAKAEAELERIRASRPAKQPPAVRGAGPTEEASIEQLLATGEATMGLVRDTVNTFSEIEVAVSSDGRDVVIGTNGRYATSNDGGQTFVTANLGPAYPRNGDPSLGFGQSKSFYYGFIAYPDGNGGTGNDIDGCTTGIMASTDRGLTFQHRGHAAWCQRDFDTCFPDQEHIAVDRWNPSASNQDQLYNTWRNFTNDDADRNCDQLGGGYVDVLLTCSVDGGAHWNNDGPASIVTSGGDPQGATPVLVSSTGDFPRITVGQDGFVYVTYLDHYNGSYYPDIMVAKYSPCAQGLSLLPGFPVVAAADFPPVQCPMPGLDRCNDGNDLRSATLAVNDLDPSLVTISLAITIGGSVVPPYAPLDEIWTVSSEDGGYWWSSMVRVNSGFGARRYMPWSCSVCGETFIGWYDRRSATNLDNSLSDYYLGRVKQNVWGSLDLGTELRVSPTPDSQCGPPGDPTHWCAPRSPDDSESCTQQPQLAGNCVDDNATPANAADDISQNIRCDFSSCGGANTNIIFPDGDSDPADICACTAGAAGHEVQCRNGGGCPMYGDYNGIACAAGRVYATWASATPPGGPQDPDAIRTFALVKLFGCEPQIQIPGDVDFTGGCGGGAIEGQLEVCNTGKADLEIDSISSSDPQFAVTTPTAGYPVVISPDFCFPFEVSFTPQTGNNGLQTATLTIVNNDPLSPQLELDVEAVAEAGEPNIVTTFVSSNDFGTVCIGSPKELDLTIHNSGGCPLSVSAITSDNTQFKVGTVSVFPLVVEAGDTVAVPLRFQPSATTGTKSADLTITSNDPDTPTKHLALTGLAGAAGLDAFVADNGNFGKVCAGDFKDLEVTIQNNGVCPLIISETEFDDGGGNFLLPSGVNNTRLEAMNSVVFPVRFAPTNFLPLSPRSTDFVIYGGTAGTPPTLDDGVSISGTVPPPDIDVPDATPGIIDFGNVCAGVITEREIPVCNTGGCNLSVTSAVLLNGCNDFTIVANPFPATVSPDFCIPVKVQYTPTEAGPHECTLEITSNDPGESPIDIILRGTTPLADIDVRDNQYFLPEVVQSVDNCTTAKNLPISNNGGCPLVITDVAVTTNPYEYALDGLPSFPIPLQPGHTLGDGDLRNVFAPDQPLDRDKSGQITVTYEDDPIAHTTTQAFVNLCGEGVLTGARVLVTNGGSNVDTVARIQVQRIVGNRNRRPQLDTVGVFQNVPLHFVDPSDQECSDFYYHVEWGTESNPVQLVPGYYQVTATITVNGKRRAKSVAFSLTSCDFNPTVVVAF